MCNYFLFSPIGSTDPVRYSRDGALIHICRKYKPKKIVLFMSSEILENHKRDNRYILSIEALKKEPELQGWSPDIKIIGRDELNEVQKMDNFISEFKSEIEELKSCCKEGDKILLNVSSGTPAMKYSLQLLSTEDRNLLLPVQVNTPKKACNTNIIEYNLETEWYRNEDNNAATYEDRCSISKNDNLFVYLLKEKITELIKNYDYSGALTIAKSIEWGINKDFMILLEAAKQRLSQDYIPANKAFKERGYKMLFNETGDVAKMLEYILYLNIKIKTDNYIEFTRGITPVFEDLLYYKVKNNVSAYIISGRGQNSKWDVQKLKSSEFAEFEFVKFINPKAFIRSGDLIEIIEKYYSKDSELINIIHDIRNFESITRNSVAHEIKSLDNADKKNCETVFDKIMRLAVNVKLINGEQIKKFLKSYDDMNDFLLSESYIKT